ncbi:SMP-30/gluconolactonase/LRE family protein [Streptomyces sp. NBC_00083]|uniref:SMP-30/gluconolactonase/LRE family protein n=1 Tax=Streptomyces sp. NBC_00083 TaxID=2975647 RepID=UPI002259B07D|nr:SMP-30/gluconolactonase/LRE family protein [Streptomyces sp. NBC_00083]MCX5384328.1 SMP-30/gluconolactonase/LRE family protein [Streptomyces sp. NBC_00083]
MRRRPAAEHRPAPAPLPPQHRVALGGTGPEDVVFDASGRVLTAVEDGRVLRITLPVPGRPAGIEEVGHTRGRPLGLEVLPDGRLLVCDARRGLLRLDPGRGTGVEVLADSVAGTPLRFCSNATAAMDGTVYFTVSSRRHGLDDWLSDIVEHEPSGLLVRLAPGGEPEVLLDGLQFANGVALAADESFVTVAETGSWRLTRLWLGGPDAGRRDTLADALPGFPDNVSRSPGGGFWVALAGPRTPLLERLHRASPGVRRTVAATARRLPAPPASGARVIEVDEQGRTLRQLRGTGRRFRMTTSVAEHGGRLVMGSLLEHSIAWCELPAAA